MDFKVVGGSVVGWLLNFFFGRCDLYSYTQWVVICIIYGFLVEELMMMMMMMMRTTTMMMLQHIALVSLASLSFFFSKMIHIFLKFHPQ